MIYLKYISKKLLDWLDSDLEKSAQKYGHIHEALIKIFLTSGFSNAEELADVTIDRVAGQIQTLKAFDGEKIRYFIGVARNVKKEYFRIKENLIELTEESKTDKSFLMADEDLPDQLILHLKTCLKKLAAKDRKIVLEYYDISNSGTKKKIHKKLADKYSLSPNTLRVQVFRVKQRIAECLEKNNKTGV